MVEPHGRGQPSREQQLDRLTRVLVVAITLGVMLNGLPFWARRVGLLDRSAYAHDLALFCRPPVRTWWLPASCSPHRRVTFGPAEQRQRIDPRRLYRITPRDLGLKALRYAVLPLLVILSTLLLLRGWQVSPPVPSLLPLAPLLLSTLISAAISLPIDGLVSTVLNGVWSLWIPLAAVAGWLAAPRRLRILADGAAALVILQLPFLGLEAMRGVPMAFGGSASPGLPTRLSGLLNQPNTLGGVLAIGVALCVAVSQRRWQRWPLLLVALAIAVLARSGTGVMGLVLVAVGLVHRQLPHRWRSLAVLVSLLVVLMSLPQLLGRPRLFESPTGRLGTVRVWIQQPYSVMERWLGFGLASTNRRNAGAPALAASPGVEGHPERRGPSADGLPLLLLSQGGVVAVVAFYGLALWCFWLDPGLRMVWGVLLITSLTLNITEAFPLGVWLAVLTSRALTLMPAGPRG